MTKRREFSLAVKKQRLAHATKDGHVHCEKCGKIVKRGQYHFDHLLAAYLGGEPTFANCRLLCIACHAPKSRQDKTLSAKSDRVQAKTLGIARQTQHPLRSRGFGKSEKVISREARSKDRLPVPPRKAGVFGCFRIDES